MTQSRTAPSEPFNEGPGDPIFIEPRGLAPPQAHFPFRLIGRVTPDEMAVIIVLQYFLVGARTHPSYPAIAKLAKLSLRTTKNVLKSLRDKGMVSWESRWDENVRLANRYSLLIWGDDWVAADAAMASAPCHELAPETADPLDWADAAPDAGGDASATGGSAGAARPSAAMDLGGSAGAARPSAGAARLLEDCSYLSTSRSISELSISEPMGRGRVQGGRPTDLEATLDPRSATLTGEIRSIEQPGNNPTASDGRRPSDFASPCQSSLELSPPVPPAPSLTAAATPEAASSASEAIPAPISPPTSPEPAQEPPRPKDRVVLTPDQLPTPLQPIAEQVCVWWNEHKGGKRTKQALAAQTTHFIRIVADPGGGVDVLREQIETAIASGECGGRQWQAMTYQNFQRYGRGLASPGSYARPGTARPGPPLRRIKSVDVAGNPTYYED